MPTFHLIYRDARGRAELTRMMFAATKTEYTEKRFKISFMDGEGNETKTMSEVRKVDMEDFNAESAPGAADTGMGQMPVLVVDGGRMIGQSMAIERYVARITGLMGSDEVEAAQIDQLTETQRDMRMAWSNAGKEAAAKEYPHACEH